MCALSNVLALGSLGLALDRVLDLLLFTPARLEARKDCLDLLHGLQVVAETLVVLDTLQNRPNKASLGEVDEALVVIFVAVLRES